MTMNQWEAHKKAVLESKIANIDFEEEYFKYINIHPLMSQEYFCIKNMVGEVFGFRFLMKELSDDEFQLIPELPISKQE